jgi:ParB family chromosome partitioning protein
MYVCTDPTANGQHHLVVAPRSAGRVSLSEMSEEDRKAARAQRRDVIESNKASASAQTVRRNWQRTFLTRKDRTEGHGPVHRYRAGD